MGNFPANGKWWSGQRITASRSSLRGALLLKQKAILQDKLSSSCSSDTPKCAGVMHRAIMRGPLQPRAGIHCPGRF